MSEHELPPGWVMATLDDVRADHAGALTDGPFRSNLKSADYVPTGPRVVRLGNIGVGRFLDDVVARVTNEKFAGLRKHEVIAGDVLIAMLAEPVGRACLAPAELGLAIVKADCARLRVRSSVEAPFLVAALNCPQGKDRAEAHAHGSGRMRINLDDVRSLEMPLAPQNEQRRIVAKLERLGSRSTKARAHLGRVPQLLEKLKRSILAAAFRGDLTADWRAAHPDVEPASKLLERIRAERRRRWEDGLKAKGKDPKKATYEEPAAVDASELPELPPTWCWITLGEVLAGIDAGRSPRPKAAPQWVTSPEF